MGSFFNLQRSIVMTQQVSDDVLGRFARQQNDWFRRVREGALDPEVVARSIQAIIDEGQDSTPFTLSDPYTVTVPYTGSTTVAELIKLGNYDWANDNITDEHFPQKQEGEESVDIVLAHFDEGMESDDVLSSFAEHNLRPATVPELLALGAAQPDLQREFPIIELAEFWGDSYGNRYVVYLNRDIDDRNAHLAWYNYGWNEACRFAAVRM